MTLILRVIANIIKHVIGGIVNFVQASFLFHREKRGWKRFTMCTLQSTEDMPEKSIEFRGKIYMVPSRLNNFAHMVHSRLSHFALLLV